VEYSIGFDLDERNRQAINRLPSLVWTQRPKRPTSAQSHDPRSLTITYISSR
jgi:hypothetical protein